MSTFSVLSTSARDRSDYAAQIRHGQDIWIDHDERSDAGVNQLLSDMGTASGIPNNRDSGSGKSGLCRRPDGKELTIVVFDGKRGQRFRDPFTSRQAYGYESVDAPQTAWLINNPCVSVVRHD
jgi:hypothetical protein